MNKKNLFGSARLKVEWANQHITDLNVILQEFIKSDFYSFGVDKDAQSGYHLLKLDITKPLPRPVPLLIGDVLHNLRSALDHVAFEIVTLAGQKPSHHLYFPIARNPNELKEIVRGREVKLLGPDVIDLILNVVKPHPGGNDPLVALNQFSVIDKHRLLIPLVAAMKLEHVNGRIGTNTFTDVSFTVKAGANQSLIASTEKFEMQSHGKPTFGIFFDKGTIFEGRPIFPTIPHISQAVSSVIDEIAKVYLARS